MSRDESLAEITGATHILDSLRIFFAVYVCSNRPVKFKSVPCLDPRTDVDGRNLLTTSQRSAHGG